MSEAGHRKQPLRHRRALGNDRSALSERSIVTSRSSAVLSGFTDENVLARSGGLDRALLATTSTSGAASVTLTVANCAGQR